MPCRTAEICKCRRSHRPSASPPRPPGTCSTRLDAHTRTDAHRRTWTCAHTHTHTHTYTHTHTHTCTHTHSYTHARARARSQIVADIQLPLDDYRKDLDEWSGTEEESQVISSFEKAESNAADPTAVTLSIASSVTPSRAGKATTTEPGPAAAHRGGAGGGVSDFDGGGGAGAGEVLPKKNDRNRQFAGHWPPKDETDLHTAILHLRVVTNLSSSNFSVGGTTIGT